MDAVGTTAYLARSVIYSQKYFITLATGPNLPFPVIRAAMVEDPLGGVILIGGLVKYGTGKIYKM
jgi:hypothetical protein